ncbi:MAG TPA: GNAT family N-acetyltransferase [Candidatus Limnocylindrales bacterium]|nr:GNAT family N-acetyltransferase [Candidatus Limnocylindrales bacterium]
MRVRDATAADRDWLEPFLARNHMRPVARRGAVLWPLDHPMLIAQTDDGRPAGVLTYIPAEGECEVLTLHAVDQWQGAGTALIAAIRAMAADRGWRRVWLVTTNDNVDALRFYQRRGFRLTALRPGAIDAARRSVKPEIPLVGNYGIPIRDEIELELVLG